VVLSGCNVTHILIEGQVKGMRKAGPVMKMEADPAMAEIAITGSMKQLEGRMFLHPEFPLTYRIAAEGFASLAYGFLEPKLWGRDGDLGPEAEELRFRINNYYMRARTYARKYLEFKDAGLANALDGDLETLEAKLAPVKDAERIEALLWTAYTITRSISFDAGDMELVAMMPTAKAIYLHIQKVNPKIEFAMPHTFVGVSNSVLGPGLGGNLELAKTSLDEAIAMFEGKYLMTRYMKGRFYCVAIQDRECFDTILGEVADEDADIMPERRLTNTLAIRWAKWWLDHGDLLF
jgi:hypothetical protein